MQAAASPSTALALRAAAALVTGLAKHVPAAQRVCTTAEFTLSPEQAVLVRSHHNMPMSRCSHVLHAAARVSGSRT